MAQENNIKDGSNVERLKATGSLTYSQSGYSPSKAEWELTADQIREIIKKQAKVYIEDIDTVTSDVNHRTGAVSAFVWLPKNSRHVCNNDLRSSNSAVNRSMTRYSNEIKEFMNKFCDESDRRIVSADEGVPLVGIRVAISRFMVLEFDESGTQYAEKYGTKNQRKAKISLTSYYSKGDDGRFGQLQYTTVTKKLKNRFTGYNPKPKKSYNAR